MKKRVLMTVVAVAMVATILTGCGKGNDAVTPSGSGNTEAESQKKDEIVTLTFASLGTEAACHDQVMASINEKLLADGLNIQVQVKLLDDYWQKLALDIAAGEQYDLAWAHSSTLADLVSKKVYVPITDVLDSVGQELKAKTPEYALRGGSVNGEIYAIPRVIPNTGYNNVFAVRKDLMDKYEIESITTIEDLENYFQAILDHEEGMYPYSGNNIAPLMPVYANYHFVLDISAPALYVDPQDPDLTVKSFWESEEFIKICEKRKEWLDKGYMITDSSKIDNASYAYEYGKIAAADSNVMGVSEQVANMTQSCPEGQPYTVYLEPDQRWIFNAGDNMLAIPSTSKHVEEAVQLIQWFKCNQENYDLWSYGVEGINYKKDGEAIDVSDIAPENVYSPMIWMWNDIDMARFPACFKTEEIERLRNWDSQSKPSPLLGFTLDQSSVKAEISQMNAVLAEYSANLASGVVDIHDVRDEVLTKLKAAGIDKVIEETQRQVDAFAGK